MIFLDLEVPEYESMRTQEYKIPNLIKTLRGKGTLENSNEYGFEDRLHLTFTVNEENLIKLLKVYSRFQTMCVIPMFNKNLKSKIYDSYLEYKKNVLRSILKSVDDNYKNFDEVINNSFNKPKTDKTISSIKKYKYNINPDPNDCIMVFLESFSFLSNQSDSNGYTVEMILWVCNDITFYNDDELDFLEKYYEYFSTKKEVFERIDNIIDSYFNNKKDDLNITFKNTYNEQETYSPEKQVEMIAQPVSINIPSKYITQVEVRAMNNLHRIPIVGKTKGFIQHLGKGEIGVTVKLVLNQKNALDEKIIHDVKSLALYQQEYITTSFSDFYLFNGMDIKELNLSTNIIEEPSDDVDVTVVTLFFTAAGTNKNEIDNNYFTLLERGNTVNTVILFNKFLNFLLDSKTNYYDLSTYVESNINNDKITSIDENLISTADDVYGNKDEYNNYLSFKNKLKKSAELIIDKSSIQYGSDFNQHSENYSDFTFMDTVKAYEQIMFDEYDKNQEITDFKVKVKPKTGILNSIARFFIVNDKPSDSVFADSVLNRIEQITFKMISSYNKTAPNKSEIYKTIFDLDNETQAEFIKEIFVKFLSEFFKVDYLQDYRRAFIFSISNVFKIEVVNNLVYFLKRILETDWENEDIIADSNLVLIDDNGNFNANIKKFITNNIIMLLTEMNNIISQNEFEDKVLEFMISNYYSSSNDSRIKGSLAEGVKAEILKLKDRINLLINSINSDSNNYLLETVEMLFKLNVLGKYFNITYKNSNFDFTFLNNELKTFLVTDCIFSLIIADLNFENSVYGNIAIESAKNLIGPHVITFTSLNTTLNEITTNLKIILNGQTLDEFRHNTSKDENSVYEIRDVEEYNDIYNSLNLAIDYYDKIFGSENFNKLLELNKTFIKVNNNNLDFQQAHGVTVFNDFETPLDMIKKISQSVDSFKNLFTTVNSDLKYLDEYSSSIDIEKLIKPSSEGGEINETGNEEIDKLLKKCVSVFAPATAIANLTINKSTSGDKIPVSIMNTELLAEMKLLRGMRAATRMVLYQYERMMPDYEIFVIDEKYVEQSFNRGYDYANKFYSLRNVSSLTIKKDGATNLKFATIKLINTVPHYTGMDYIFESNSIFADSNSTPEVVYSNKYKTNKIVFKAGMLVNISLDKSSQFYDFTGKIDSVVLTNNIITLNCSSFASELLGNTFDIKNVSVSGFANSLVTMTLNLFRKFKRKGETIANSKTKVNYLNGHLIPEDFIDGRFSNKDFKKNLAGASGILYTSLYNSIQTLKHLDCPYNELLMTQKLGDFKDSYDGKGIINNIDDFLFSRNSSTTSYRITENINAVEFDVSFYGVQMLDLVHTRASNFVLNDRDYNEDNKSNNNNNNNNNNLNTEVLKDAFPLFGHSSFVPSKINNTDYVDILYPNSHIHENDIKYTKDGVLFGFTFSYQRDNVHMYEVLNDLELRNPAAYWDVFESGNYGTLFLGRSNYMISRKNKTASLSREDIDNISDLVIYYIEKDNIFAKNKLNSIDMLNMFKYLSECASIFDNNFAKDSSLIETIKSRKLKLMRTSNKFFGDVSEINKDIYSEESPASDIIIALSGYNLISCNIATNENYINTVNIRYKPGISGTTERLLDFFLGKSNKITLKSFEGLPDERIRAKAIDPVLTKDLHSSKQAFEYAQSVMFKELVNYYDGKIVILYCPNIKKYDEVLLIDSKNKISGTVVVKAFEHIIDSESGAITVITPGMKIKTSSLLTDIYLTGIKNKIAYELAKRPSAKFNVSSINKVNEYASNSLRKIFGELFNEIEQLPIAFDNIGYDAQFDKEAYDKSLEKNKTKPVLTDDDEEKQQVVEDIKLKVKENTIVTPRNVSNLPFKLYPLIKNGKALLPDEDIYNSIDKPFDFVTRLIVSLKLMSANKFYAGQLFSNILSVIEDFVELKIDLSDASYYNQLVKKYFTAFTDENINYKEFIDKMIADDYNQYHQLDDDEIPIDKDLYYDKDSIVFFNCKQLNQYEDDRIRKIAKILCQYTIVHLVELNGKITTDNKYDGKTSGFESSNFTVVNKLIKYMEEFNNTSIIKKYPYRKKWTCVLADRLIEQPILETGYDDIGAVLVNLDYDSAGNNFIINKKIKLVSELYSTTKVRYALSYSTYIRGKKTNVYLFHNYFGQELGQEVESYEISCNLLDELIKQVKIINTNNYFLIAGDFNLTIRDIYNEHFENANYVNKFYDILDSNIVAQIKEFKTTIGNQSYDNFISDKFFFLKLADKSNVFLNYKNESETGIISDHYPIRIILKK